MAGVERPVEDELLDELRRLQQGVLLAGLLGEVLVQVAQEARVAVLDLERPLEAAGLGVDLPPELQQLHRRIADGANGPERRLALGEQIARRRESCRPRGRRAGILPVGVVRVLRKKSSCASSASLPAVALPASQHSSIRSLSSMNRTKTQASTHATAT